MDPARSTPRSGDDNNGIPDDLRCKRSDGKQWRCTAKSMPDKTVCERHYVQAKKRAANSALRASMKKGKRRSLGESNIYLESKSDDLDSSAVDLQVGDSPNSGLGKDHNDRVSKGQGSYSAETPSVKSLSLHHVPRHTDNDENDDLDYEDNHTSYKMTPLSAMEASITRSQEDSEPSDATESSDGGTESSDGNGGQICHQCQQDDGDLAIWCLRCDRRGYCDSCISTWYSEIPLEEIQEVCPACRGTCTCKICIRTDNLIKIRIREIPAQDKLLYLHSVLSSVLPVVKQIHHDQCLEVELERKLRGNEIDLPRTKLNADEQMCCDCCRTPIIDYHRHCANCSYDMCLKCCQDLREASGLSLNGDLENHIAGEEKSVVTATEKVARSKFRLKLSDKFSNWKANSNSSIPCPPQEYGGCGCLSLTLKRIFKMNWVAKLVKNSEEMVSACEVYEDSSLKEIELNSKLNALYCPTSEAIKLEGIGEFLKHWSSGEPVIVKDVFDSSSMSSWDPVVIWKGVRETAKEKMKNDNRAVKAVDCLDWSEVYIELGQFIKGYSEGRVRENGWPEMLKLKDWPSPSASEEFLLYQRPDFISRLPLLEFIHSKLGLLNVAAKLPHYSLQNDAGLKIYISYGMHDELGRGDSVDNLHRNTRDMVYLLVHTSAVQHKGGRQTNIEEKERTTEDVEGNDEVISLGKDIQKEYEAKLDEDKDTIMNDQTSKNSVDRVEKTLNFEELNRTNGDSCGRVNPGTIWDVFRREDVPKLIEYIKVSEDLGKTGSLNDCGTHFLYDTKVYLNGHHKRKLKEEFGVEPWSFEQCIGQAVFIPAGCLSQVRNLQSTVQLGLDFLSPESVNQAAKLVDGIRILPNDHDAKLRMLEVGKISLYAACSAIKEVQKLVLDPKLGVELGYEDPNLTAMVSENMEKMVKRRQINTCA